MPLILNEFDYQNYVPLKKIQHISFKPSSSGYFKKYSLYYINILKFFFLKINSLLKTR